MKNGVFILVVQALLSIQSQAIADSFCDWSKTSRPTIERKGEYYTNFWAVRIIGGTSVAQHVAKNLGYLLTKRLSEGLRNIYLLQNTKYLKKTYRPDFDVTRDLTSHPQITWAEQQVAEKREVRRYNFRRRHRSLVPSIGLAWDHKTDVYACPNSKNSKMSSALNLNDKYWPLQYYLRDCRNYTDGKTYDMNLAPVWVKHGLFGKGIKVVLVDDGLKTTHPELADNFDPSLGLDLQDEDETPDPKPDALGLNYVSHGTSCAGIIAMKPNNTLCGVGIAPLVTLGAVRYFGPRPILDFHRATGLTFKHAEIHIMSNSWGKIGDGKMMAQLSTLTRYALKIGVTEGRQGLGLIYVFGAGNGKYMRDYCSCDSLVSDIRTIAVASCSHRGRELRYSERCPSIMVTTYSGSTGYGVVSADISHQKCTRTFGGTSASTPMVSGAIALALEANPKLSWRDVQHLLTWTCQVAPLHYNPPKTWQKNGAGFYVSHDFGFGVLDINGLVEAAKQFRPVGPMNTCVTKATINKADGIFPFRVDVDITTKGCEGTPSEVKYLEHVQLAVTLSYPKRGDLRIVLVSPSKTKAKLLRKRPRDLSRSGLCNWTFDSVLTWGEAPQGTWTVMISAHTEPQKPNAKDTLLKKSLRKIGIMTSAGKENSTSESVNSGQLIDLTLILHGTSKLHKPHHYKSGPRTYDAVTLGPEEAEEEA